MPHYVPDAGLANLTASARSQDSYRPLASVTPFLPVCTAVPLHALLHSRTTQVFPYAVALRLLLLTPSGRGPPQPSLPGLPALPSREIPSFRAGPATPNVSIPSSPGGVSTHTPLSISIPLPTQCLPSDGGASTSCVRPHRPPRPRCCLPLPCPRWLLHADLSLSSRPATIRSCQSPGRPPDHRPRPSGEPSLSARGPYASGPRLLARPFLSVGARGSAAR